MEGKWSRLSYAECEAHLLRLLTVCDKKYLAGLITFWFRGYQLLEAPMPPVLLALVLYAETRGSSEVGRRAVFEAIANRVVQRSNGFLDTVLLEPQRFSCFNPGDMSLQRSMLVEGEAIKEWLVRALNYVTEWNAGEWTSKVFDATMYCTPQAAVVQFHRYIEGDAKAWNFDRLTRVAVIGGHVFFRES